MEKIAGFIVKSTFFIIFFEAIFGATLIHFVFHYDWLISLVVGISFATVGEAILIPILDDFKVVNTKLGQMIIGIGTFDDVIEIIILIVGVLFLGIKSSAMNTGGVLFSIVGLIFGLLLATLFIKFRKEGEKFKFSKVETLFLFSLAVLFLFIGLGEYSGSSALGALLAGISLKTFLPKTRVKNIEDEVRSVCYGFFAPIFFLSVGLALDIKYLIGSFSLVVLVFFVSAISKLFASYIFTSKKIGRRDSILMGIGLSARFSTSIVIIKILLENNLIKEGLYSVIVASSIIFTLIIPIVFSALIARWKNKKWKLKD